MAFGPCSLSLFTAKYCHQNFRLHEKGLLLGFINQLYVDVN